MSGPDDGGPATWSHVDEDYWDAWVADRGRLAAFTQTSLWGRIGERYGRTSYRIAVGSTCVHAGMSVALLPPPAVDRPRLRRLLGAAPRRRLEALGAPVLTHEATVADIARLVRELDSLAEKLGIGDVTVSTPPTLSAAQSEVVAQAFMDAGYVAEHWLTSLVDLSGDERELGQRLPRTVVKALRRAASAGLTVDPCTDERAFTERFLTSFNEGRMAAGLNPANGAQEVWQFRMGYPQHFRFWTVASRQGEVLATLGTYRFNGVATEIMSIRTPAGVASRDAAQDLVHWEAMRWHQSQGDELFDLAGFSPSPTTQKEAGIRRFKEKWGGRTVPVVRFNRSDTSRRMRLARRADRYLRAAGA